MQSRYGAQGDLDSVLTVPNALSLLRLVLLGVFVGTLVDNHPLIGAMLLAFAGLTDFLDGYVARRFNQVSTVGKVLDPTIDRIVVATAVIAIVAYGAVPVWIGALVLAREAFVSIVVLVLAGLGAARIDVLWIGKAGTFGLMCYFPLALLADGVGTLNHVLSDLALAIGLPSLALSLLAVLAYIPHARRALAAGRESSVGSGA